MVLLWIEESNEEIVNVMMAHYKPSLLTVQEKERSIEYNGALPEIKSEMGKTSILKYDKANNVLFYELVDGELTDPEKLKVLEEKNTALKERLDQAEADNITTLEALAEVYEMLLALQA